MRSLRARQQRRERIEATLLETADAGEARHIIHQQLRQVVGGVDAACARLAGAICQDANPRTAITANVELRIGVSCHPGSRYPLPQILRVQHLHAVNGFTLSGLANRTIE